MIVIIGWWPNLRTDQSNRTKKMWINIDSTFSIQKIKFKYLFIISNQELFYHIFTKSKWKYIRYLHLKNFCLIFCLSLWTDFCGILTDSYLYMMNNLGNFFRLASPRGVTRGYCRTAGSRGVHPVDDKSVLIWQSIFKICS